MTRGDILIKLFKSFSQNNREDFYAVAMDLISDSELKIFREKLNSYSGLNDSNYEYGYFDAIEDIVPLEPEDRIGRLLELKPLENDEILPLDCL